MKIHHKLIKSKQVAENTDLCGNFIHYNFDQNGPPYPFLTSPCGWRKAKDNKYRWAKVGLGFTSDWMTKWREVLKKTIEWCINAMRKRCRENWGLDCDITPNHENHNFLDCDWFKKVQFSTN